MFSAAENFQRHAVGVILTGSGIDGLEGAGEILRNGGRIVVQDPATCLHKQAARVVQEKHPKGEIVPDTEMASVINRYSE
jgi:two-component system chemotaxis response regulator CheB